ncbi:iron-containing alcohol dehydrogenase [Alkalihalobacterium elongatum]|uniref:iron-containing alcohol dehydrogenase n=1 Tax=Alkalihalobacterium elongatum TaxID=2675466 RepID=UPI001C1F9C1F|nr:iron-containing alcohol dehydrogenase [Alkalihalobacterium elongatum]
MNAISSVYMPRAIFYGRESLKTVGKETKRRGTHALIISDQIMDNLGYVSECVRYLEEVGISYTTYLGVNTEPTNEHVEQSLELSKENNCDVVIALGGGSCIDTAKAVAVLMTNGGDISEYMGNNRIATEMPLPLIAIPTTAGTGSEATDVTVITNTKNDVKMMIKQTAFLPEVAIVDPLLTVSSPKNVTAATGVDALCHAVEAFISRRAHPFTDHLALSAIKLIFENIRQAYNIGEDIVARENMALAALQAGVAFSNASVCLVHGMSRPMGAMFHVPHGVSNAMLLPAVLEFSKDECIDQLAEMALTIKPELKGASKEDLADTFVRDVKQLCLELNIPNMKQWGIDQPTLEKVVHKMAQDAVASGSPANNPKVPEEHEIIELYYACYDYNMKEEQNI